MSSMRDLSAKLNDVYNSSFIFYTSLKAYCLCTSKEVVLPGKNTK